MCPAQAVPERQGVEHRVLLVAAVGARVPDGSDARGLRDRRQGAAGDPARPPHQGRSLLGETGDFILEQTYVVTHGYARVCQKILTTL